jgi:hypothetical protein
MATMKYAHLIKPLNTGRQEKTKKKTVEEESFFTQPRYEEQATRLEGRDLEGMSLTLDWGFKTRIGNWYGRQDPHVHPHPEIHMYVGLDTANINYLGAEIATCLGIEQETYTFTQPMAIVIPAGVPHGPTTIKRIYSPKGFGFYVASLAASPQVEWRSGNNPGLSKNNYAHLLKPLKAAIVTERGQPNTARFAGRARIAFRQSDSFRLGPGNADHLAWLFGDELEGLKVNLDWGFFSKTGLWHRGVGAHRHPVDEVLVFAGVDPADINYLGAEIEIDLGKEHERHIINRPSVVICPAGMPHCPIITRWVDKPFAFFSINLSPQPEASYTD